MGIRDAIAAFQSRPIFDPIHKTKIHILTVILVITVVIVTIARISTKPAGMPTTRADTLSIVMGIKTLVFLLYQVLTSHVAKLRRWRSFKAYQIINTLEIVFWFVVVIITFMGMARVCSGTHCGLGWLVAGLSMVLMFVSFWAAVICRRLRLEARMSGVSKTTQG